MITLQLECDRWGRLAYVDPSGQRHEDVTPVRPFPITDPDRWVSLCDSQGRELLSLESLADVEPDARRLLIDSLNSREFIPVIEQVYGVSSLSEPCEWDVQTDRGRNQFVLRTEADIRRLGPHQAFFVDSHGIRYLIRDVRQLDAASRRFVEWYL